MTEENKKKNKIIGISLGILIVLLVLISSTYALWQITAYQDDANILKAACLNFEVDFETGLTFEKEYPIKASDAIKNLTGYKFTITNNCQDEVIYTIGLESLNDTRITEYMSESAIAIAIDDSYLGTYDAFDELDGPTSNARNSKGLISLSLGPKETKEHVLKMWIDENASINEQNKSFVGKLFITGGQGVTQIGALPTDENCFTMDETAGEITKYDSSCGTSVVIPAMVKNIAVKSIDTDAFKGNGLAPIYYDNNIANAGENITPVDNMDFSRANVMFVFDNYQENTGVNLSVQNVITNATYIVKLTADAPVNGTIDGAGEEYSVQSKIKEHNDIPELEENQISVYANLDETFDGPIIGAKYMKIQNVLIIDSLDLSRAINLEKIEASAFSNVPSTQSNLENYKGYNEGLKNLTFGNNDKIIELGHNAFARMNVNDLKLFMSSIAVNSSDQEYETMPFGDARISNLIINGTVDNSSWGYIETTSDKMIKYGSVTGANITNLTLKNAESFNAGAFNYLNIGTFTIPNIVGINESIMGSVDNNIDKVVFDDGIKIVHRKLLGENINKVELSNTIEEIEEYAFSNSGISEIKLSDNLTKIGKNAFESTKNLQTIDIPNGVTTIPEYAFSGSGISEIKLSDNLTEIGENAFASTKNLQTIDIPNGVTIIPKSAFSSSGISEIKLSDNLTEIKRSAFESTKNLQTIDIPNGVTAIREYAFSGSGISEIKLSDNLMRIERNAFNETYYLTEVKIPNSVSVVEDMAFFDTSVRETKKITINRLVYETMAKGQNWYNPEKATIILED